MKILTICVASIIASGALFAADFSKSSNADLLNMAGKISASDARDFFAEVEKRVDEMTGKEAREFWETYRANEEKVFDNMKVKDIRAYKRSLGDSWAGARGDAPFGKKGGAHRAHKMHDKHFGDCPCGAPNAPKHNAPKAPKGDKSKK